MLDSKNVDSQEGDQEEKQSKRKIQDLDLILLSAQSELQNTKEGADVLHSAVHHWFNTRKAKYRNKHLSLFLLIQF